MNIKYLILELKIRLKLINNFYQGHTYINNVINYKLRRFINFNWHFSYALARALKCKE